MRRSSLVNALTALGVLASLSALGPMPTAMAQVALDYPAQVVQLINGERQKTGLWPLRNDFRLTLAAALHDDAMESGQCFAHDCPGEADLGTRVDATGYSWYRLGETLALNVYTPADVVAGWMASDPHKAILLGTGYGDVGCDYLHGTWATEWTCDFAWDGSTLPPAVTATPRPPATAVVLPSATALPPTTVPTSSTATPTATATRAPTITFTTTVTQAPVNPQTAQPTATFSSVAAKTPAVAPTATPLPSPTLRLSPTPTLTPTLVSSSGPTRRRPHWTGLYR